MPSSARRCRWWISPPAVASIVLFALGAQAAPPLPSFNVDIAQTSVSGLSSGGYMAMQFDVAFSSMLKGAGIIAGGPYYCAQGSETTATSVCSCAPFGCFGANTIDLPELIRVTDRNAARGLIDATSNLQNGRYWLFSGKADTVVPQRVMNDLQTYLLHYVDGARIFYKNDLLAEHAQPTHFFGNRCEVRADPYINNCHYDGAGALLQWIYGALRPKGKGRLGGSFIAFDQREFLTDASSHGLAEEGWLFVPTDCADGRLCRLHVAFHGCRQFHSYVYFDPTAGFVTFGTTFVRNAGYNRWADTNGIIVLYPQATATLSNPLGCWDWWGYDDPDYATQHGRQIAAVREMIRRIASGAAARTSRGLEPAAGTDR